MDIFENLENLNVSEECFDEIMNMVEELLNEGHNLEGVVTRAALSGRIPMDTDKWPELSKKAMKIPSSGDIHRDEDGKLNTDNLDSKYLTNNDRGMLKNKKRQAKKPFRPSADALSKGFDRRTRKINKLRKTLDSPYIYPGDKEFTDADNKLSQTYRAGNRILNWVRKNDHRYPKNERDKIRKSMQKSIGASTDGDW
jgi:hypothetical protein